MSCRSADWLGANDRTKLDAVSPSGHVIVLNLDPLSQSDISHILDAHPEIDDPEAFVREARERGLDGLLKNPQSLNLLVNLVAGGGSWPEGRRETFERACSQMVAEHNTEHRIVERPGTVEQVLDAAGRLCAIQVIAGVGGYASRQREPDEEYLDPDRCDYEDRKLLRSALSTKLFTVDEAGITRPVHRHIAEFVGALHLSKAIEDGLPAKRAIALMTGGDGFVVTELRGLSAWLAAVCKPARATLIDLDPVGVGLYGDIHDFSLEDKHALLSSLMDQASQLDSYLAAQAFAGLAVPGMASAMRDVLTESDRSNERQSVAAFLMLVLTCGQPMAELAGILLDIIRDDTRRPDVRQSAIEAFVNCCQDANARTRKLRALLDRIHDGRIGDPRNELLGTVLSHMYPQDLPPSEVWDYLNEKGDPYFIGSYCIFWKELLIGKSSNDQVAELMANLKARIDKLRPALERHHLNELPLDLLERILDVHCAAEIEDLYDWLSIGTSLQQVRRKDDVHEKIRVWLERHPETQKAVIAEGLFRCPETRRFEIEAFDVYKCLYGAELPADFGLWCLKHAVAVVETKPLAAEHLLEQAVHALRIQSHHEGLSIQLLRSQTEDHQLLNSKMEALLSPPPLPPHDEDDQKTRELLESQRRQEAEWMDYVRSQEEALQENRADPSLLCQMAESYLGGINNFSGGPGVEAIEQLLQGDRDLTAAALQGLRNVIDRPDVPDIEEVLKARNESRMFYLSLPFLVGMAEIERTEPETLHQLDEVRIRRALAFYYTTPHGGNRPGWYRRILLDHPEIVADVQMKVAVSKFKGDQDYVFGLWDLAHDQDHAEVARLVSIPLLRVFPVRCRMAQTDSLDSLLWAAIQHTDRAVLEELIDEKRSCGGMNVSQKARWIAAGLVTSPETHLNLAEDFSGNSGYRIRHLAALFRTRVSRSVDARVASLIIRLMGNRFGPDESHVQGRVTPAAEGSRLAWDLINRLSGSPDGDASSALDALTANSALRRWSEVLSRARDSQRVIRRDALYRHPTVEQACRTLNGATPANAGDLAALLVDRLEEITLRIRKANTDDWHQYWNEDSYGRPVKPKHEDHCRDALLSDLRLLLPSDVDAQPEGQYANDRRSDIRVAHASAFHVPVEIKKNGHPDLWSGMHDQLIEHYASDPETCGFGIYLAFWFGPKLTCKSPDGGLPDGPDELREQLEATLSPEDARKISVCVIDVSPDRE